MGPTVVTRRELHEQVCLFEPTIHLFIESQSVTFNNHIEKLISQGGPGDITMWWIQTAAKKAVKVNRSQINLSHYDWNLLGLVLVSRKSLDSKRPRFTFLASFSRLLEAISIAQIKADTNAPIIKYATIKIPAMVMYTPFVFAVHNMNKIEAGKNIFQSMPISYLL